MFANLVNCKCEGQMRLEQAEPGIAPDTLLLTFRCGCGEQRCFLFAEIKCSTVIELAMHASQG